MEGKTYNRKGRDQGRADRSGKPGRNGRPNRFDNSGRPDKPGRPNRPDRDREVQRDYEADRERAMVRAVEERDDPSLLIGRNPIREAMKAGRTIEKILVARGELSGSIREILSKAKDQKIVVQEVDRSRLDDMVGSDSHQGIAAIASVHHYVEMDDILNMAREKQEDPFIIVLDEITDPHNLGSIIRTAECCGAHGIVIPKRRAAGLTATVAKASSGAIEYVPVAKVTNIAVALEELKKKGLWIAGASMDGQPYYQSDLKGPIALVIGSEGEGIGRLIKEKCDFHISIPLKGRIESLNASVAAAILMYEVTKQRL